MLAPPPLSASRLLRVEHAVAEALLDTASADDAFPRLLAAVGEGLGWHYGGIWLPVASGALHCVATWSAGGKPLERFAAASRTLVLGPGEGLPGRVQARGRPAWIADVGSDPNFPRGQDARTAGLHSAFAIPLAHSGGAMEFLTVETHEPDEDLMATLASLGRLAGQFVEQRRTEAAVRESEARKRAMLDAALDAVITIDAGGRIVEVNAAVEDLFGHPPQSLIGRELASALVPDAMRAAHRRGLAQPSGGLIGRRIEITALHADGREIPVELTITRIDVPGPPMYTGYVRDITDRLQRERELRESRARIVAAADAARRRLERDLHDGAQNRLLAIALDLKLLQNTLSGPEAEQIAAVREELALATDELRELARGIHPAVLTQLGLVAALRTLARRTPLPVGLEYECEDRCPAPVEAAAYFLVAEALTNVVRSAEATRADVHVGREGASLTVTITDDGRGGADPAAGSGLRGMQDRLVALDGSLTIDSPVGGGTRVTGVIPCGS
ncbi:PAS domain S-box protein [Solirubrobacter soli]|uniref:PAS domain S-box protein n=1 Tax=Solirubrobacter soli TaxID=363832 RepID=UPI0004211ED3|nr:PAS domain S-box protein [Solirubrobacter soli]